MPLYEPTIPYRYVAVLVALLRDQYPRRVVARLLSAAGVEGPEEVPADASLPMSRLDRLLSTAGDRLERRDLGFEMGRRITLDTHVTLRPALERCATLQEMLLVIERYYHLVTPTFAARFVPGRQRCEWRIRVAAPMSQTTLHACLEMHAVSVHADLSRIFGADMRADIYLSAPPPPHAARYRRLARARFHFSSGALPEVRCVLPTELLHRHVARVHSEDVPAPMEIRSPSQSGLRRADRYGEWVGLMLREAQAVQPTVADLAALLDLSPRTLRRRLNAERINFRALGRRIRHERARAMLLDPGIAIHQVAYQLGYSDATAFSRAFRIAAGVPPALFRNHNI